MKHLALTVIVVACALVGQMAATSYTYVGSYQVDQGPYWPTVPPAYTGQTAAALVFGGNANDYAISTVDSNPADINFSAWYSTWAGACNGTYPCGTIYAEDYVHNTNGYYQYPGDVSAYVRDWAVGSQYTNYVFKISAVPEPSSLALLGASLVGLAGIVRRKLMA